MGVDSLFRSSARTPSFLRLTSRPTRRSRRSSSPTSTASFGNSGTYTGVLRDDTCSPLAGASSSTTRCSSPVTPSSS
ncbi:hypothetical protein PS1_019860 [Malus domestica]